jgi:ribosomal protein S6--L-glutamate ligase
MRLPADPPIRRRLLLVEDEERIASFLVRGLGTLDVDVVAAADGDVGAFLGATERFDVVVLDLSLPGTPGIEILRLLHETQPDVPVILLTAHDEPKVRAAALAAGAAEYVTKPFVFEELRERIRHHLDARTRVPVRARPIWVLTDVRYLRQRMPRALIEWLETRGHWVQTVVADREPLVGCLAGEKTDGAVWGELAPADLVVVRSRHPFALALLRAAEAAGARSVPSWASLLGVRNKVRGTLELAERGLPVPATLLAHRPGDLAGLPDRLFPLVLKPVQGDNAQGVRLVRSREDLPEVWPDALLLAQPYIDAGGLELKLYVVGEDVWAVRRRSPLVDGVDPVEAVRVGPDLRRLALACADAFGLELLGVDVLEGPQGPVIVDVNEFPNYTGVGQAPEAIGRLVLELSVGAGIPTAVGGIACGR